MITSKRNISKFYLPVFTFTTFFCALGLFLIIMVYDKTEFKELTTKDYLIIIYSNLLFVLASFLIRFYWKKAPKIKITHQSISFGKELYPLNEISKVKLTGSKPFLLGFKAEAATIHFKDKTKRLIFNDMYSNTWKIKLFLKQVIVNHGEYKEPPELNIDNLKFNQENLVVVKGVQWTSFRGLILWGTVVFFTVLALTNQQSLGSNFWYIFSLVGLGWYLLNSWLMHYVIVTKRYIVIKNHNLVWIKKIFPLNTIKEVAFEAQPKSPNKLRIITKDYKDKVYACATLRTSDWKKLKSILKERNIKVRYNL